MGNCQKQNQNEVIVMNKLRNGPVEQLQITTITWNKDFQGLFDYQTKQITKKTILLKQSGIMLKMNNQFKYLYHPDKATLKQNSEKILFKFIRRSDSFCIEPVSIQNGNYIYQKSVWMIVKSTPQKMYSLRQGDIIKLGRQRIRVKQKILKDKNQQQKQEKIEINAKQILYQTLTKSKLPTNLQKEGNQQNPKQKSEQQITEIKQSNKQNNNQTPTNQLCRICLDPGTNNNPLITPCKCAGSMKYIHLICLQMWLGKRLNPVIKQHSVTINWKPLLCQLCTSHFLYKIYIDNKRYYTVEIPRPPKPYLVLQVIHRDKTKKKVYHLISFSQKKKLNLGRKQDTDVRISDDISVSRNHSSIRYDESTKQFIIQDLQSKFGTLILVKKRLVVRENTRLLSIQVGPNVFQFEVRRAIGQSNQQFPIQQQQQQERSQQYEDDEDGLQEQQPEEQQKQEEQNVRQPEAHIVPQTQPLNNLNPNQINHIYPQPRLININQKIQQKKIVNDKNQESKATALISKKSVQKIQHFQKQKNKQEIKQEIKQPEKKK